MVKIEPVNVSFYRRHTLELAQALLGMLLVHESEDGIAAGWIVETEAYRGPHDRAAHSYGHRRTARTEVMFGPPGMAYVYEMHTHSLFNVVSGAEEEPEAVLIRAIEPCEGLQLMYERRGVDKKITELASGPGKLTKALGIDKSHYGKPLFERPLYIAEGRSVETIAVGERIGIDGSGEAKHYPWRFWEHNSPFVSRPKAKPVEIVQGL